jgi:hypothetical protein
MKQYRVILPFGNIDEAEKFYSAVLGIPGKELRKGDV